MQLVVPGFACTIGNMDLFRAAVVQAGSVPFDRERSTMKALDLTGQAIRSGARLIVFPEAFISGYPKGIDFGARVGMRSSEGRNDFGTHPDGLDELGKKYDYLLEKIT